MQHVRLVAPPVVHARHVVRTAAAVPHHVLRVIRAAVATVVNVLSLNQLLSQLR